MSKMTSRKQEKLASLLAGYSKEESLEGIPPREVASWLGERGYEQGEVLSNGWEHDFSIVFTHKEKSTFDTAYQVRYYGCWYDGTAALERLEFADITQEDPVESDDAMVRRITGHDSLEAFNASIEDTKKKAEGLYVSILGEEANSSLVNKAKEGK